MNAAVLHDMAPNSRRSAAATLAFAAAAAGIYIFAVQPAEESLAAAHREHDEQAAHLQSVNADLRCAPENRERLARLEEELKPFREAMLEPLLGSFAMRAKTLLEPLASGAGLSGLDYEELAPRALPAPRPAPGQLHVRMPVRVTACCSYMRAVSFIMMVEKHRPLVALQSFSALSTSDPGKQQIEMVFEWPAKGGAAK